ncbi:MAG: 30S ribosomal protein S4 [Candidatus Wildermuthbacteria bacterium]|nr:30S ribosomal protein S4 [Candidatus Wildermuthbacteria bacterium]
MQKGVVRKRRTSPPSEYARQLMAKQELRREYNLKERQFKRYVKEVLGRRLGKDTSELLMEQLERRLDNAVFRMGLAETRSQARQMVGHGHIVVNGKIMDIPSHTVEEGDTVSIHPSSKQNILFKNAMLRIKKYNPPAWIELDREQGSAKIIRFPQVQDLSLNVDIPLVFEFYSR